MVKQMKKAEQLLTRILGGALLFVLLCFLLNPVKADAATVNQVLPLNTDWTKTRLSDEDQVYFFSFTTPSAGEVKIDFCSFAEGQRWQFLDADLQRQSWGWSEALWGTSPSNPKSVSETRWLDAGTYVVRVDCYNHEKSVGDFWVKASFRAAGNQELEPNQTYAQAQNTAFGTQVRGVFTEQDENDYFTFTLSNAQTVSVQVACYCSGIRVRLMDSNLKVLTSETVWGASESDPKLYTEDVALTPGKYYVHLDSYGGDTYGLYDYKVTSAAVKVTEVRLNRTNATLNEGESLTLTATVNPANATDKSVNWSTSRSTVATVDANGRVTALGAGTAVITATAADGSGASASCEVTVKAKPVQKTLSVDKTSVKLYKGQKVKLHATTTPSGKITYSSSNKAVAKVSKNGKITALKKGKCTITVAANGMKRTVTVKVKEPSLQLKKTKYTIPVNAKRAIVCTVKPDAEITYTSSNKKIAKVNKKGVIKAKKKGKCTIYVRANGIKKAINITVK